jgi:amino acid adenylation domain-containing protein
MKTPNVEDFYPLSPLQQGMLFRSLQAPAAWEYFIQVDCLIRGNLVVPALNQAIQKISDRHPILRTSFVWERVKEPVQIVHRKNQLSVDEQDWRNLSLSEQAERIETWLQADRQRGFDLSKAPLMRISLIRLSEDSYRFIWSIHHLLLDGWSMPMVFNEVFAFYEAYSKGSDIQLPSSTPFREYILWLRKQDILAAEKFWRKQLQGFTTPVPLMVDRKADPSAVDEGYGEEQIFLTSVSMEVIKTLTRQHGFTTNNILQAAWALLLSRYSGENDIVFGVVVSGRSADLAGIDTMVGMLLNTLPMRISVSPSTILFSWLKEIQDQQTALYQYEYTPLASLQKWSEVPRGTPLFESIMVFENYPVDYSSYQGDRSLNIQHLRSFDKTNYPLTLVVETRVGSELLLKLKYDSRLFERTTAIRTLGNLKYLIEALITHPEAPISTFSSLTREESKTLLVDWNDTDKDYRSSFCLHELIEQQVEHTPDGIAVKFDEESLTYVELNARANQLAHRLIRMGVGSERVVGVYMERSIELVIALLGTLKAGGAYLPLDPDYPQERLAFMLQEAEAPVVLTQKHLADLLPAHAGQIICVDSEWEIISNESSVNPKSAIVDRSQPAYVIYTSGSTGKPKGAVNTHHGICNRLLWMQDTYQLTHTDRVLQKTPFSFDVSVWEFFWPLITGACLVVAPPRVHRDSALLVDLIIKQAVTVMHFVPSMLRMFLAEPNVTKVDSLRHVICSGEALLVDDQERFLALLNSKLHNLYGPTEASVDVTFWECNRAIKSSSVPIGHPIANTQIYLLDHSMNPVPIGAVGELYIGGVGLGRGYFRNAGLTADRFVPNCFARHPGERLYRTGDLARYLPDGSIEFLGRIDHQVKIRGNRIELGEIEALIRQYVGVRECVVIARQENSGDRRIIAYIVSLQPPPTVTELRSFLASKLPEFMLPAIFVFLDEIPLTTSGKVDRKALPAPDGLRPELEKIYVAPTNPIEEALADIWSQILRIDQVGIYDNFFELGGDSIISIQVVTKAREKGLTLSLQQLFRFPTIHELAQQLVSMPEAPKMVTSPTKAFDLLSEADRAKLQKLTQKTPQPKAGIQ